MPKIDLSSIPGLETAQGIYGSLRENAGPVNDIVDLMVYVYNTNPPVSGLI